MLNPNIGILIRGLRTQLKESVLPELTSGAATRQLKAGLHLLARLERTWDLTASHVLKDNEDIESCLAQLFELNPCLEESLAQTTTKIGRECIIDGFNDPVLSANAQKNQYLHCALEDIQNQILDGNSSDKKTTQSQKILNGLYLRMATRDSVFVGDHK